MKHRGIRRRQMGWGALFGVVGLAAFLEAQPHPLVQEAEERWTVVDASAAPVRNLALPLQHYPEGAIKVRMQAAEAWIPQRGWIRATNVVVELFSPEGLRESSMESERTLFDRRRELAVCLGAVRFEHPSIRIEGDHAIWMAKTRTISIVTNARVELPPNTRRWTRKEERP